LLPEKSKNTEIGVHYDVTTYEAHVVAYSNTISNLIQFGSSGCTAAEISQSGGCANNVGLARITGVSFGGAAQLGNFSVKGSVDQQNPENVTNDTILAKRARTFGNLSVEYAYQKWIAGIGGTFSGQRQDVSGTDTTGVPYSGQMGGYSIFNLYSSYEFEKNWTAFARWNNFTNRAYQLTYGYNTMGSNIYAGIRYAMQ
jgi:vitamin B12 transporter